MLTVGEIKSFIDDDATSEKKRLAAVGQRYYEGKHDILNYRMFYFNDDGNLVEDKARANVKISHPFFTELSDQLAAYMLSFKENPIRAKESAEGLQDKLDLYFDDDFWAEIGELITGAYNKGFEYLYGFKGAENRLIFQCADSLGVVEVREQDTDDHCKYIIYWYVDRIEKGKKEVKRIQLWSETETTYFVQDGEGKIELDKSVEINPRPHVVSKDPKTGKKMGHALGFIPFWRLDNNKKQINGLKPIKALIDDYDLHACSLSNNLKDFDVPLHVVSGFQGDNLDELQNNLKTKKIIGIPEAEGGVDIKTVDIPYEARKTKLEIDEKNIYRFGFGFNSAQVGDGNITNIVIRSRYTLLDLKANKMEKRLRRVLKDIIKAVLDEINAEHKTDYQLSDITFDFTREVMTNETENVQNAKIEAEIKQIEVNIILNVAATVGDEQTLKAICEIMDWDFDELQGKLGELNAEKDTQKAKALLESVVTNEQAPETDPTTIPE